MELTTQKQIIKANKKNHFKSIIEGWQLYLFILLPIVSVLIFSYIPMFGVQLAFKVYDVRQGIWGSDWVGLENFMKFFNSYLFTRVLKNTISISLYGIIAGFPIPIIFALMLNSMENIGYKKAIQTITYTPHFISMVVLIGIVTQFLNPRIGAFGIIYSAITNSAAPNLMADPNAFPHIYVWSGIWQQIGWSSIVYIAVLSAVDSELHEAAKIDGATRFKRVIHIDFPSILPTAIMLLILSTGSLMNVGFEKTFLLQNDLNLRTSEVISTYVYKVGIATSIPDYGYGTAVGLFNSVVNLILLIIVNSVSKRVSKQSLW